LNSGVSKSNRDQKSLWHLDDLAEKKVTSRAESKAKEEQLYRAEKAVSQALKR